jgi:hypothetical protein
MRAADSQRPGHALVRSATGRGTITIVPQYGETFAPAPASATPKLTAQQAWERFMRHVGDGRAVIPSDLHVQLGLFTLPAGPADAPGANHLFRANGEAYTADDELAYGYSSPPEPSCVTMNPMLLPPPDARCISWTFLNANTGEQIVSTYQKIGHWHWLHNPKGF